MATYVNDLRLKEIATGDESGTWGTSTNTNLELIGEALGYGTQDCFASDADATTTVADGASDPARAMYFKVTSSATLTATRTLTIAPNTISRVMLIENATTGSQSITISQGSGSTVTIASGAVKMVYLDGAGAGGAVVEALADLELPTVTVADLTATTADINGGTIDGTVIGGTTPAAITGTAITATGIMTATGTSVFASLDISGDIDVDGTTNLDVVDIDGAVDMASTLTVGGVVTANAGVVVDNFTLDGTTLALSSGSMTLDSASQIILDAAGGNFQFLKSGTEFARFFESGSDFYIYNPISDKDIKFYGNDGGVEITALTLDMSAAGAATFSSTIALGDSKQIFFGADSDGRISFDGTDTLNITASNGSATTVNVTANNFKIGGANRLISGTANDSVVINEDSADVDFRVESNDNANMLFVDGGANHVNIGTSSDLGQVLNVEGGLALGTDPTVTWTSNYIKFQTRSASVPVIEFLASASGSYAPRIDIYNGAGAVQHRIDAGNATTFNETGADNDFRVESDSNTHALFVDASVDRVGVGATPMTNGSTFQVTSDSTESTNMQLTLRGASDTNKQMIMGFDTTANTAHITTQIAGSAPTPLIFKTGDVVFNEVSSDSDFRVESNDNANMLFVDGGANQVTIGSSALLGTLSVNGSASDGFLFSLVGGGYQGLRTFTNTAVGNGQVVFEPTTVPGSGVAQQYTSFKTRTAGAGSTVHNVIIDGSLSKGSGSFKIDHPLDSKKDTHHLIHSFIEGPQADNIYRGKVTLVDGSATVNIDSVSGMSEGTYVLLNTNTQCFTSNESGWTAVKGSVAGNILTIEAQESCSDTISWMVVGERHDQHMLDTEWTDENGKVIVEPLKELES
jgi:hypothetical protein